MAPAYWEVVGGQEKGGIVVRAGKKLASDPLPELLSVGSIVEEVELAGNRLHFRLLVGTGPKEGWASVVLKEKYTLLERCSKAQAKAKVQAGLNGASNHSETPDASYPPGSLQSPAAEPPEEAAAPDPEGERPAAHDGEEPKTEAEAREEKESQSQEDSSQEAKPKLDHPAPSRSEVREDKPKTHEDWRQELAKLREANDKELLARTLQQAAKQFLKDGLATEAAHLAKDAAEQFELLGLRAALGVAWDTVAKAELQSLREQLSRGKRDMPAQRARQHCEEVLRESSQAVSLLRQIEDPSEEADLASARFTLSEVRALADTLQVPLAGPLESATGELDSPVEDTQALAQGLLETAKMLLKDGMLENAAQLAREAVKQFRSLGSRWQQGIAWDTVARTQLELLKADGKCREEQRQELRKEALAAACKAVALLCTILHPSEEKDLTAAQATFDEVAKQFSFGDEILLARTLLSAAKSLLGDGQAKGALELATSAVEHFRQLGDATKQLSAALEMVARIHLRLLPGDADVWRKKERHGLALAAVLEAVKVLGEDEQEALAAARCTLLTVRAHEPGGREVRLQELEEKLGQEVAKHFSSGKRDTLARTLESTAVAFHKEGAYEKAIELASSAATHFQQLNIPDRWGMALDVVANAHLELLKAGGHGAAQHRHEAVENAKQSINLLGVAKVKNEEWEESLQAARSTLDRARRATIDRTASKGERGGPTAAEASLLPLQRTFGYIEGLEKPSRFARFDVRDKVCVSAGGFKHGQKVHDRDDNNYLVVGVRLYGDGLPRLWFQPEGLRRPASCCFGLLEAPALKAQLSECSDCGPLREVKPEEFDAAEDSDHEIVDLCHECLLPLGVNRYPSIDGEGWLHGECMAEALLDSAQTEDKQRKDKELQRKVLERQEFNIGWRPSAMIRSNRSFLQEQNISCPPRVASALMCCLTLEGDPRTVRLTETTSPEGAVNIAYLALALQVRLKAGSAPFFSLDTPRSDEPVQVKTFGPPWLQGTCMGEVLFQADYHLKELSMGEAEQPVIGMPSVWDFDWKRFQDWRGREWFVVKNATVRLSEDNVLLPQVEMGVEGRQQVANERNEVVDVPVTSTEHPLVKYAEVFTRNFNLIAERKSIFYQLREVTKASILAKFLVDNKVVFDDSWLKAADRPRVCQMEIPHNTLERQFYNVLVCDGVIKAQQGGIQMAKCWGIYGGVDLNIDAFDLSMPDVISKPVAAQPRSEVESQEASVAPSPPDVSKLSQRELRKLIQDAGGEPPRGPAEKSELIELLSRLRSSEEQAPAAAAPSPLADGEERLLEEELRRLALSKELLQAVLLAARRARSKMSSGVSYSSEALLGKFWDGLDADQSSLLRDVFNKRLSDRCHDGDLFVPPVTTPSYLNSLRELLNEERAVQEKRRRHFLSKDFVPNEPGELFPSSWRLVFSICFARGSSVAAGGDAVCGQHLVDSEADASHLLQSSKPVFDRVTEDGVRYRIYRGGSLEVRTLQDNEMEEEVGKVFELSAAAPPSERCPVIKVTQFVKSIKPTVAAGNEGQDADVTPRSEPLFAHFAVYETDLGDAIVTERLSDGTLTWDENPLDLESRYARARVIRAADCSGTGLMVGDVKSHCHEARGLGLSSSRRYAEWLVQRTGGVVLEGGGASRLLVVPPQVLSHGR